MNGKINRIITKSISRFARNTVTLLTVVRTLRDKGIGVYFEEQNIDTLSGSGELLLTLLASQAQEESRMASENCKWRIRRMFEQGYTTHFNMNGYRSVHGLVQPVPEEAETVQRIFRLYLEGNGIQGIANRLQKENVFTRLGGKWTATTTTARFKKE